MHVLKEPRGGGDRARRGNPEARRPLRQARHLSGLPLRRPAAARRDRPRARHAARRDPLRRADLGARSGAGRRGAEGHPRPRRGRPHHDHRHPRDGLCARRLEPRDVPAPRAGGGGGPAAKGLSGGGRASAAALSSARRIESAAMPPAFVSMVEDGRKGRERCSMQHGLSARQLVDDARPSAVGSASAPSRSRSASAPSPIRPSPRRAPRANGTASRSTSPTRSASRDAGRMRAGAGRLGRHHPGAHLRQDRHDRRLACRSPRSASRRSPSPTATTTPPPTSSAPKGSGIDISPAGMKGKILGVQSRHHQRRLRAEDLHRRRRDQVLQHAGRGERRPRRRPHRRDARRPARDGRVPEERRRQGHGDRRRPRPPTRPSARASASALRKEDTELLGKVNAGIKALLDSGEYDEIAKKYFDFDIYGPRG